MHANSVVLSVVNLFFTLYRAFSEILLESQFDEFSARLFSFFRTLARERLINSITIFQRTC
jgi:hypothetical protein